MLKTWRRSSMDNWGKIMKLIDDWKRSHKLLSIWVFAAIGAFPDIYQAIVELGWSNELPEFAKWSLRVLAVIGIAFRLIKQEHAKAVE